MMSRLINDDDWILLKEATEELYGLNANISAAYCTKIYKPTHKDMMQINKSLGIIIKKLRSVQE